jgi:hypothetical protein
MYEIFPKKHGPLGIGILGFSIAFNLLCIFQFFIRNRMIPKESESIIFIISISIGGLIGILGISFFTGENDYEKVLEEEKLLSGRHNQKWRIITWIYLLVTIVSSYFILFKNHFSLY